MTAIKIKYYTTILQNVARKSETLYPTEGCHIVGAGKVAGLFRTIEDAIAGDSHAEAIIAWDTLTPEEQAVATANSEWLANQPN